MWCKLYVLETPYCRLYNLDAAALEQYRRVNLQYPPTWKETVREMTPEEIRTYYAMDYMDL